MKNPANSASVPAPSSAPGPAGAAPSGKNGWVLCGCVVFAFLLIGLAYVFAFRAAHEAQIKEVPLATKGVRP